jgi:hypothetical protein
MLPFLLKSFCDTLDSSSGILVLSNLSLRLFEFMFSFFEALASACFPFMKIYPALYQSFKTQSFAIASVFHSIVSDKFNETWIKLVYSFFDTILLSLGKDAKLLESSWCRRIENDIVQIFDDFKTQRDLRRLFGCLNPLKASLKWFGRLPQSSKQYLFGRGSILFEKLHYDIVSSTYLEEYKELVEVLSQDSSRIPSIYGSVYFQEVADLIDAKMSLNEKVKKLFKGKISLRDENLENLARLNIFVIRFFDESTTFGLLLDTYHIVDNSSIYFKNLFEKDLLQSACFIASK